jgi:hypothetical protein
VLYEQLAFIYRLKLHALFINGENEAALYIDSDLRQVGLLDILKVRGSKLMD